MKYKIHYVDKYGVEHVIGTVFEVDAELDEDGDSGAVENNYMEALDNGFWWVPVKDGEGSDELEDKRECVARLFEAVKCSRSFQNLTRMEYKEEENGDESVLLYFRNKYSAGPVDKSRSVMRREAVQNEEEVRVNVTADSCIALIKDVMETLYRLT